MTPVVRGRGAAPTKPPPQRGDCAECGKPFADREHRGVQTHMYRRADGLTTAVNTPPRMSVDEMATQMLSDSEAAGRLLGEEIGATVANQLRMPMQELAAAVGQMMGVGMLDVGTSMAKVAAAQRRLSHDPIPPDRPSDPNYSHKRRPRRHRRFPCAAWKRRCRCHECHRVVDYAHIEAMERECEIRNEEGELAWPPPSVGDHDRHGRTVVAVVEGHPVWDRTAPPPPPRDPGMAQRV